MKKYQTTDYLYAPKPKREVRLNVIPTLKKPQRQSYKIPKTPKESGLGWGG